MIDLTEMITANEGKSLEFKRDMSSLRPILKTLVAFANTAGGVLVHPLPEWVELGSVVRCVFPPHPEVAASVGAGTGDVPANVPANVPVNVPAYESLNERQRWFLEQVAAGAAVRPRDLAEQFGVSEKTAKRDVAALSSLGLVEFVGPTKTGRYRLPEPSPGT